ncbi:hypothetical protein SAMN03080617_00538 [Algoriphagus alkaliphilus]|uniref:Uncharacterized protein n=1 Tax=Algoriphagus alkaliphilus TaxID=279824 RepID=A0A1G5VNA4_9BACT|nr:hypothetical protein SAMN03080617_00538 [Algoriphagus alkaliphilus]
MTLLMHFADFLLGVKCRVTVMFFQKIQFKPSELGSPKNDLNPQMGFSHSPKKK